MPEEIATRRYTRKEAETATQAFIATGCKMRQMLLDLYEREAHTALGYTTFEEYTKDRIGTEWKPDYLRQLRQWARIEREAYDISYVEQATKSLPFAQAMQLARLPEGTRKAAYEECVDLCEHGKVYRPQAFTTNLTHIVNRRLKALAPPPEPSEPSEPAATTEPSKSTAPAVETEPEDEAPEAQEEPEYEPGSDDLFEETTPVSDQTPPSAPRNGDEPDWSEWTHGLVVIHGWVQKRAVDDNGYTRIKAHSLLRDIECWITRSE